MFIVESELGCSWQLKKKIQNAAAAIKSVFGQGDGRDKAVSTGFALHPVVQITQISGFQQPCVLLYPNALLKCREVLHVKLQLFVYIPLHRAYCHPCAFLVYDHINFANNRFEIKHMAYPHFITAERHA